MANKNEFSYEKAGVNISVADETKRQMASSLHTKDPRVLNSLGAFASLFAAQFPGIADPVLVMKMEEPGSKQKLALQLGRRRSICFDLINHLINDIAVMGAIPLAVQDCIVCGKLEQEVVTELVRGLADACREQQCSLIGGETSEQPGVIPAGTYILSACVVGIVDKNHIVDGSSVRAGDAVLAIASNGLHTNGYSLVRKLIEADAKLAERAVGNRSFIDAVLEPHLCYLPGLRSCFGDPALHGLAHITGGGIAGNLNRIMPQGLSAVIETQSIKVPELFTTIQQAGNVPAEDMFRTFNMGVGIALVCESGSQSRFLGKLKDAGFEAYEIGVVREGTEPVVLS